MSASKSVKPSDIVPDAGKKRCTYDTGASVGEIEVLGDEGVFTNGVLPREPRATLHHPGLARLEVVGVTVTGGVSENPMRRLYRCSIASSTAKRGSMRLWTDETERTGPGKRREKTGLSLRRTRLPSTSRVHGLSAEEPSRALVSMGQMSVPIFSVAKIKFAMTLSQPGIDLEAFVLEDLAQDALDHLGHLLHQKAVVMRRRLCSEVGISALERSHRAVHGLQHRIRLARDDYIVIRIALGQIPDTEDWEQRLDTFERLLPAGI
ncbi:hypothetical protein C8R43DRAFT_946024 [Mycena crocata]|nr:hypothetical protein C8R43DRAFT_946024 [Mycena crocata]